MRRALIAPLVALALVLSACASGSSTTTSTTTATNTVATVKPPNLPVVSNAETNAGTPIVDNSSRPCVHYFYVIGADGHRHRHPCNAPPTPPEPDNPHPAPTPPTPYHPASGCGIERWAVKTLTDPGANQVKLSPVPTTVSTLGSIAMPSNPTDRLAPVETTVYKITGTLTIAKQEADHDFHLVVASGGSTMIVEIPDPACAAGSVVLSQITAVRQAFVSKFGTPGSYPAPELKPNVPVTVTGVGFFDRIHGQTGVAPNGIELHPALSITYG